MKNGKYLLPAAVLLTSAVASMPIAAESASEAKLLAVKPLEVTVVTGTRTAKLLEKSPVSIDVIDAEEIEALSAGTLDEVLEYLPGVYLSESVKDGSNIMMRGFDGDRVLVLVDGQRLLAPTGASVDFEQISSLDIERIEIVRGASSALYGSDAMGGVINIITRSHSENQLALSHELGAIEDNTADELEARTSLAGSWSGERFGASGYLQVMDKPGFDPDASDPTQLNAAHEKTITQLQLAYTSGKLEGRYKFQSFDEHKLKIKDRVASGGYGEYRSDVEKLSHGLVLKINDFEVKTQAIYHSETSGDKGSLRDTDIDLYEFDSQYTWAKKNTEWVAGLHAYQDGLNQVKQDGSIEVDNESANGIEAFVNSDWQLSERLVAVAGVRLQSDSGYGQHTSLRLNGKYEIPLVFDANEEANKPSDKRVVWRVSLGDGYRVPTLKERYYEFDHSHLGYVVLGNEALAPEEVISVNTSLEYSGHFGQFDFFSAELSVHASEGTNFIDSVEDPTLDWNGDTSIEVTQYKNIESTRISGADISTKVSLTKHELQLNYNYLDARDTSTNQRLQSRPYNQVKANYRVELPWNLDFLTYALYKQGEAVSAKSSDATQIKEVLNNEYTTINLTLSQKFDTGVSWKLGIKNIFDEHEVYDINKQEAFDLRPTTGRYFFASFKYLLN